MEFKNASSSSAELITIPSSFESCQKSGDLQSGSCVEGSSSEFVLMGGLKKSVSVGNVLDKERNFSYDDITEDEARSPERIMDRHIDSSRHTDSAESNEHGDFAAAHNQHEFLFSVGVMKHLDGDMPDHSCEHSANHSIESPHLSADTPTGLVKSRSLTNLRVDSDSSTDAALLQELTVPHSKSFENLNLLNELNEEHSPHRADYGTMVGCNEVDIQGGDGSYLNEKNKSEYKSVAGGDFHNGNCSISELGENTMYDAEMRGNLQKVSYMQNCDDLTSDELKIKRIEEWISQIEIPSGFSVEEVGESSETASKKDSHAAAGASPGKPDARNSAGMEVASAYISSLSPAATSVQITNLGLVLVPILSSFAGLKVLNLSGNAIGIVQLISEMVYIGWLYYAIHPNL